nr:alpha-xylosidase 1-like [Tanacetum cinerariifolium]
MKLQKALDEVAILEEQILSLMHRFADRFTDRRVKLNNMLVLHDNPLIDYGNLVAPTKIGDGYRLVSLQESSDGGLVGLLKVNQKNNIYGPDIPHLQLYIKHETDDRLRIHITDAQQQRWEVPYDLLPRDKPPQQQQPSKQTTIPINAAAFSSGELIFSYISNPFSFAVKRTSTDQTLFNSSTPYNSLVFKDQYIEISTSLPHDASLYGLGENSQPHGIKLYPNDPYTLWTTDQSAINLNMDLYGSHPVYMDLRNNGHAHGVLLLNSNGMDIVYRGDSLTYKVIGGVLDFYVLAGPTPLGVVDQYTQLIGRPAPMPYWSLGFHQCRWGYHNLSVVEDVVENYNKAQIPLDVIWNDDDHMDNHKDFTLNPVAYPRPKLLDFLQRIHDRGMKYIVIIDPGIGVNSSYGTYQRGIAKDVFIKYNGKPYLAQVWPGAVNFPDFMNPATVSWWADEVRRFHELVPVDGLWIDMNEASNFCSGLCTLPEGRKCPNGTGPGWVCCLDCKNITNTKWDDPPYKINASGTHVPIGYKTIATSAVHYNGVREYDAHSMYGFSHAIATHKALEGLNGKRPFILSRSTFVGSGKYTAHWTGDNQGAPIARPLFFSFPNIPQLYGLSTQFLLGESLMVSPVLDQGRTNVSAVFPPGTWYGLFDQSQVINSKDLRPITLDAPLHVINVHLYQNTILPMQRGGMISKDARMTPFTLIVAFPVGSTDSNAKGKLYLDNDELPEMRLGNGQSTYIDFSASASRKTVKVWSDVQESKFALDKGWYIEKITVLGSRGIGGSFAVEVEGESDILDVSKVEVMQTEHKFFDEIMEDSDVKKSMMVEVGGLNIPI